MSSTGYRSFDTTVEKSNLILKSIEEAYGWTKEQRHQSYDAMRAVLHALRDRLPVQEAADLGAPLPMLIRGIYYEGWVPSRVPMKMHRDELYARIGHELPYEPPNGIQHLVTTVLHALGRHVSKGEWDDIAANLPKDIVPILTTS
jgi:uncharacterized protein (DUF2267 family)